MSTDELISQFAAMAKRAGSIWNDSLPPMRTPQRRQAAKDIQPIGEELRRRKPIAKLRELFKDESPDVRFWSGGQFLSIDFEWAYATMRGLAARMTVQEVLALRERVFAGVPPGPELRDMTIVQLIDRFKDACERLYATTRFLSDEEGGQLTMVAYNHVIGDSYSVAKEFAARGKLDALVPLLEDPLITVRLQAAAFCLPVATVRALTVLETISATKNFPEFMAAGTILDEFRKGTYKPLTADR